MKEIGGIKYPRTIIDVRTLIEDPTIHLECTGCNKCRPDNIVPCESFTNGMSETGIGVMCMDKKVQITGRRIEVHETIMQIPSGEEEIILDLGIQDSEIEH